VKKAKRHRLARTELDLTALRDRLEAKLGRPVELIAQPASEQAEGEVIVIDRITLEHLDVPETSVATAVALTPQLVPPESNEQATLAALAKAKTDAERVEAIRGYLQRIVEAEKIEKQGN
jgi:hypothetical protein